MTDRVDDTAPGVWAPTADRVDLDTGGTRHRLERDAHGWWRGAPRLATGTDYAFVIDGNDPLPDPRSPWQPHGVHGPSRTVDHDAFAWHDHDWRGIHLASAVLYELHVGTFTPAGTFDAAAARLDHLVDLGVSAVSLMPVNQFPGRHGWGYDGVDLYAPHHDYGGPDGFKRFVDTCHGRGLAVVLDVVYNHLGPSGNYLARFGPYFTDRYSTPWGPAVNLDGPGSDEVRRFVLDNACMWIRDYHVDGLRLDAVHAIVDTSAVHILEELADRVGELATTLGRHVALIAESSANDPRLLHPPAAGGYGLDAVWSDDFHHALHVTLTGERDGYYVDYEPLVDVAAALQRAFVLDGRPSRFRGRRHGRPVGSLPGSRFLGYLQNHDQVGNRARGDRSTHLMSPARLRVGAALVLTSPFVPMLFQGEEWGASTRFPYFCDHIDPGLADAVREGRRDEFAGFGWDPSDIPDPQDPDTVAAARLDWSEPGRAPHDEVLDWHRRLVELRRRRADLADGRLVDVAEADPDTGTLTIRRGDTAIMANVGAAAVRLPFDPPAAILLASGPAVHLDHDHAVLPPDAVVVLDLDPIVPPTRKASRP